MNLVQYVTETTKLPRVIVPIIVAFAEQLVFQLLVVLTKVKHVKAGCANVEVGLPVLETMHFLLVMPQTIFVFVGPPTRAVKIPGKLQHAKMAT